MENRLSELMEIEEEYEEMKTKLKYEDGKFLNNDRKDNEILIIRGENTNLKKAITTLEEKIKQQDKLIEDKINEISSLKSLNTELNTKLDEKQKELNLCSNININISNHPQMDKCPFCNNIVANRDIKSSTNPIEAKPQLKVTHFQKVMPNLMKKSSSAINSNNTTFLNQTSSSVLNNNYTKGESNSDRAQNDFLAKYFTNKHSKSKSQLNHSSIKITRLPNGHMSNRSNAPIPPINQQNFSMNNINAYKQLFNSSVNHANRKNGNKTNYSARHGDY